VTRDVIMTLGLLLGAGLAADFAASLLNLPQRLVLVTRRRLRRPGWRGGWGCSHDERQLRLGGEVTGSSPVADFVIGSWIGVAIRP
jgi:hypothetical protein